MSVLNRAICTLLLCVVLASQSLGGAHAASHAAAESGECAVCATYANPIAALPSGVMMPLPVASGAAPIHDESLTTPNGSVLCIRQRGPPTRI
ncbi:MAG: hypothetical protein WBN44_02580 [Woeseiaceae bacterium]|jgi:hypothetical protein